MNIQVVNYVGEWRQLVSRSIVRHYIWGNNNNNGQFSRCGVVGYAGISEDKYVIRDCLKCHRLIDSDKTVAENYRLNNGITEAT